MHWLSEVFQHPTTVHDGLLIAAKTAVIYFFLVAGLRLMGKRELGQMTIYDLVLIIVLANSVQNAMVGADNTLIGGIIAAVTLLLLNRLFTTVMFRSAKIERIMVGEPTLLANNGEFITSHMLREGISKDQIMAALREHGLVNLSEARMCVLEVDGTISVVPSDATVHKTKHHFRALRLQ